MEGGGAMRGRRERRDVVGGRRRYIKYGAIGVGQVSSHPSSLLLLLLLLLSVSV